MYFGSVKFFKNMILVVVILAIGISAAFAVYYHHQWQQAQVSLGESGVPGGNGSYSAIDTAPIDYQTLYPDFYAPQPYNATDRQSNMVYLTFDGALSSYTTDILDILAEKGVTATFFLSGTSDTVNVDALKEIAAAGHTIGMASWTGDYSTLYRSVDAYLADAYQLFTYIRDDLGVTPTVFRFPGGSINSYNAGFYQELIAEMIRRGFVPYDWNINIADMNGGYTAQTRVDTVMDCMNALDRAVLLLRSDASAVEFLPMLIDRLQENHYTCAALQINTKPVLFAYPK